MSKSYIVTVPEDAVPDAIALERIVALGILQQGGTVGHVRRVAVEELNSLDRRLSRLVLLVHELGQRLPYVGIQALKNQAMSRRSTGTATDEEKDQLLNRAEERGVLGLETRAVEGEADAITIAVLRLDHPLVRAVLSPLRPAEEISR